MRVEELKELLQNALNELENFDDTDKVKTSTSTRGLSMSLEVFDGFIDLKNINIEYDED